jgi:hypothetical protein
VRLGSADRSAQADFTAPFDNTDDHHVGDTDPTHQQGNSSESEEKGVEGAFGGGLGFENIGRSTHLDFLGVLRVDCGGEQVAGLHHPVGINADVDGGGDVIALEVVDGRLVADEGGSVQVGGQDERLQYPDHFDPLATDPYFDRVVEVGNAEPGGRHRTQHHGRVLEGGFSQERPVGDGPVQGLEQVLVGGQDTDATGLPGRDEVGAIYGGVDG